VIADKDDKRALRPAHIGERVGFTVQPKSQMLFLESTNHSSSTTVLRTAASDGQSAA
jgi:hypothetical protein